MKKLFIFIIFIFFAFTNVVFAENIKFIQVTDTHVTVGSIYSQNVMKSLVEDINKQEDISFVVFTGDVINEATPQNMRLFMSFVKKLKVPYYLVVGNHDVYKSNNMSKNRFYEIAREGNPFYKQRKPNYKFTKGGFVFVTLDGAKEVIPGATGYYKSDTLAWLDKVLTKNEKKPVVIFQHFPIEYPTYGVERRIKTTKTYRVEEYEKVLAKHHNVLAIVSGHFHVNYELMKDGVYHISSPSLLGMPNSYKIIDIVTTPDFSPLIYTQLKEFEVKD